MFGLIRRISGSVFQRPDWPWKDGATSDAPMIGRKRRYSTTESVEEEVVVKRVKSEPSDVEEDSEDAEKGSGSAHVTERSQDGSLPTAVQGEGVTEEVKAVTRGVEVVELNDTNLNPEGVPLPESREATPSPEEILASGEGQSDEADTGIQEAVAPSSTDEAREDTAEDVDASAAQPHDGLCGEPEVPSTSDASLDDARSISAHTQSAGDDLTAAPKEP